MPLSPLEIAWRAWLGLGGLDRHAFLQRFRQFHLEEREERLAANRRVTREPAPVSPFATVVVQRLDFDAR